MPLVLRWGGLDDWERKFCASLVRQSRRGGFQPSEKQTKRMAGIVQRLQTSEMRE